MKSCYGNVPCAYRPDVMLTFWLRRHEAIIDESAELTTTTALIVLFSAA